uniref:Astacin domain-containing protein n=1 Tax=Strongyloides venezuelensis TaxID=75913 RepID=A0A0K0FTL9_STRVS
METRIKKSIFNNMPLKWTFLINYNVDSYVDRNTIKAALAIMERETCIIFNETSTLTKRDKNYVYSTKCVSFVEKVTRTIPQDIGYVPRCNLKEFACLCSLMVVWPFIGIARSPATCIPADTC